MSDRLQRRFAEISVTTTGSPPRRQDWMLTAVLAAAAVAELALVGSDLALLQVGSAAVAVGLLPYRRRFPLLAATTAFFAQFVVDVVERSQGADLSVPIGHIVAGLMFIYAICRWLPIPQVAVGLAATLGLVSATEFTDSDTTSEDILFMVPWIVLALFALAMRYRARLQQQHDEMIRLNERNDLARELHDTVAHHVSAIVVQAQAAQYIASADPVAAGQAMSDVEVLANTTMSEMRRMVGILRSDDDRDRAVPAASLDGLADPDGVPTVTIVGERSLEHLPTGIAAAVYRIAQEAVTNARRHSRGVTFIDIELVSDVDRVVLKVINDGVPTGRNRGSGYGLIGMRERVNALGGSLETGPRPASGWQVTAIIPINRPDGTRP